MDWSQGPSLLGEHPAPWACSWAVLRALFPLFPMFLWLCTCSKFWQSFQQEKLSAPVTPESLWSWRSERFAGGWEIVFLTRAGGRCSLALSWEVSVGAVGGGPMAPPSPSCAQRWPGLFDRCSSGGSISHELREWSMRFNLARNLHLSEVWRRNHVGIDLE